MSNHEFSPHFDVVLFQSSDIRMLSFFVPSLRSLLPSRSVGQAKRHLCQLKFAQRLNWPKNIRHPLKRHHWAVTLMDG